MPEAVQIVECPRDAWQGLAEIIPTETKVEYLLKLTAAGLKHIDAVSFVSPKHVRQMADSEDVMKGFVSGLPTGVEPPEIIGIVVNEQGMERALATPGVTTLGYPYSISAYFRRANANRSRGESRVLVEKLRQATKASGHGLVVYISMAFGNPYDDPWDEKELSAAISRIAKLGIRSISLADTVGMADATLIRQVLPAAMKSTNGCEIGVHLHSRPADAIGKVLSAYDAGCRRFDSAIGGLGGCPFAQDSLVGNIPTESVIAALKQRGVDFALKIDNVIQLNTKIAAEFA